MKSFVLIIFLSTLLGNTLHGQTGKRVSGNFLIEHQVFNYQFDEIADGVFKLIILQNLPAPDVIGQIESILKTYGNKKDNVYLKIDSIKTLFTEINKRKQELMILNQTLIDTIKNYSKDTANKYKSNLELQVIRDSLFKSLNAKSSDRYNSAIKKLKEMGIKVNEIADFTNFDSAAIKILKVILDNDSIAKSTFLLNMKRVYLLDSVIKQINIFNNNELSISFNDLTISSFNLNFLNLMKRIEDYADSKKDNFLKDASNKVFFDIMFRLADPEKQVAASVRLKELSIPVYSYKYMPWYRKKNQGELDFNVINLNIKDVDIEFENGTLKNIMVELIVVHNNTSSTIRFRNNIPIRVNNKFSNDEFESMRIFCSNNKNLSQILMSQNKTITPETVFYINLGDVIDYKPSLAPGQEDYSPKNCVISLTPEIRIKDIEKENMSEIFNFRTYTDLMGLSQNAPNGLIQTEGDLKIFHNPLFRQFKSKYSYGFFNYLNVNARYAKMDQNHAKIPLNFWNQENDFSKANQNGAITKLVNEKRYAVNTIDLYRYNKFSIDFRSNLYLFNAPKIISTFEIPVSIGMGFTPYYDSFSPENKAKVLDNSIRFFGYTYGISWLLKPDSRYSLKLGLDKVNFHNTENSRFVQDYADEAYRRQKWETEKRVLWDMTTRKWDNRYFSFYRLYCDIFIKVNEKQKIYVRSIYNNQWSKYTVNKTYWQIQIGYQFSIFVKK